jgi:hypothetical protein
LWPTIRQFERICFWRWEDKADSPVGIKQYGKFWDMLEASANTMGCRPGRGDFVLARQ